MAVEHNPSKGVDSQRHCVVCRTAGSTDSLLPLVWAPESKLEGGSFSNRLCVAAKPIAGLKRFYVCLSKVCLSDLSAKNLSRALKATVRAQDLDLSAALRDAHACAQRRVFDDLGLARRQGVLVVGADAVFDGVGSGSVAEGSIVASTDLAERTQRQVLRNQGVIFSNGESLGRAVGMAKVGVLAVKPSRFSDSVAYWLRVWEVTASCLSS